MLVTHWVAQAGADAPPALVARVQEVLRESPAYAGMSVPDALLRAGETLLARATAETVAGDRGAALDLLAADACVTWAFEAAAHQPDSLTRRAEDAMRRIFSVAGAQ